MNIEKIISKVIKNRYNNIKLSDDLVKKYKQMDILFFAGVPFLILFFLGSGHMFIYVAIRDHPQIYKEFTFLYYIHSSWMYLIPAYLIYGFTNYFNIKYKIMSFYTNGLMGVFLIVIGLQMMTLAFLFMIKASPIEIYSYYSIALVLIIFYYYRYKIIWNKIMFNRKDEFIQNLYKNSYDGHKTLEDMKFELIEDKTNKPFLTKLMEATGAILMFFGIGIPFLSAFSSSGAGGNWIIYFVIYLFLFLIPTLSNGLGKVIILYKLLKQIEQEENITIYNGAKINTNTNEPNAIISNTNNKN